MIKSISAPTLFFLLLLLGVACQPDKGKNIPKVDPLETVVIKRFEQDLFQMDTTQMAEALDQLQTSYPDFAPIYFNRILGAGRFQREPEQYQQYIKGFLNFPTVQKLYDTTQIVYPNLEEITKDFQQAFGYLQHYFPAVKTPSVTTFISEFSIAAFLFGDNEIAVGLDYFLGSDYPYKAIDPTNPSFSQYLTRTFTREHLVTKSLKLLTEDLNGAPLGDRLLDQMIHNGRQMYLLDLLLPYTEDSIKWEMKGSQIDWLEANEKDMWAYLISEDLLYSSDQQDIRTLVDYAPSAVGMPPQAPGRAANWLGYKIVEAYLRRNPDMSIQELIEKSDAQEILNGSRYKPTK